MFHKSTSLIFALLTLLLLTACTTVSTAQMNGTTIVVSPGDSIQSKLNLAQPGDTLLIRSGTYVEDTYPIVVNQTVTLVGEGLETTIIDGADTEKGIFLVKSSAVKIQSLTIRNTIDSSFVPVPGVHLYDVQNVEVTDCRFEDTIVGVLLKTSNHSHIARNLLKNNTIAGIYLREHSTYNVVEGNTIANNTNGIWVADLTCIDNRVYHNNFVNNRRHTMVLEEIGEWHNGYPSGGNYWGNYSGADLFSGPDQDQAGSDGIGDTPHTNVFDEYPFIGPLHFANAGVWDSEALWVGISSNASITGFQFNPATGASIEFDVIAQGGEASCRVLVPLRLLWVEAPEQWTVKADGTPLQPLILEDLEYTYFYFNCTGEAVAIEIRGIDAVPEISSTVNLVLTLFLLGVTSFLISRWSRRD